MAGAVATFPGGRRSAGQPGLPDLSPPYAHTVQFYRDDAYLLEQLGQFVGPAIAAGSSVLLVATKAHRDGLFAYLRKCGTDFALAVAQNRLSLLDADETLEKFMLKGQPDPRLFLTVVGTRISRLLQAAEGPNPQVFAFGEMVSTLWLRGQRQAALALEKLWNQLALKQPFHLLCAYPMHAFSQQQDWESIFQICAEHTHVAPAERSLRPAPYPDRIDSMVFFQHKFHTLEGELRELDKNHTRLREREAELLDALDNANVAMCWIAPDGLILWANKSELARSGWSREQYAGHHLVEFQVDPSVIEDLLRRFRHRERLSGYQARFKSSDGSVRRVRIDSNPYVRDGKLVYTRCSITEA